MRAEPFAEAQIPSIAPWKIGRIISQVDFGVIRYVKLVVDAVAPYFTYND
jgi:hypothetical protein